MGEPRIGRGALRGGARGKCGLTGTAKTGELNSTYRSPEDKSNLADIHVRLARYGGER
ncbi:hypothetical protein Shyhy02_33970 [Streptomyces hygroscopicus subsp. hygroscopicus]|nr:hypothetical protein Shyhy02_33970 [Streptomyces hygroscopicus subsp. hygroscopicus]